MPLSKDSPRYIAAAKDVQERLRNALDKHQDLLNNLELSLQYADSLTVESTVVVPPGLSKNDKETVARYFALSVMHAELTPNILLPGMRLHWFLKAYTTVRRGAAERRRGR